MRTILYYSLIHAFVSIFGKGEGAHMCNAPSRETYTAECIKEDNLHNLQRYISSVRYLVRYEENNLNNKYVLPNAELKSRVFSKKHFYKSNETNGGNIKSSNIHKVQICKFHMKDSNTQNSPTVKCYRLSDKVVYVRGYFRKDGTYVAAHTRRYPVKGHNIFKLHTSHDLQNQSLLSNKQAIRSDTNQLHQKRTIQSKCARLYDKPVFVRGYLRKDGTYVSSHFRRHLVRKFNFKIPRTKYTYTRVRGYFRKNGTYVRPYYRRCKRR